MFGTHGGQLARTESARLARSASGRERAARAAVERQLRDVRAETAAADAELRRTLTEITQLECGPGPGPPEGVPPAADGRAG